MASSDDNERDKGNNARKGRPVPPRNAKGGAGTSRAASRRREAVVRRRRQRQQLLAAGVAGLVIVVIAVFVIVKASSSSGSSHQGTTTADTTGLGTPVAAFVTAGFAAVKPATLADAAHNVSAPDLKMPSVIDGPAISSPKPTILYIGAEYCPFCATERWAMVMALSHFGTFSHLTSIRSSPDDGSGYESVPTFSFYKSTYTSPYLTFTPVEEATVSEKVLQTPTAAEDSLVKRYDIDGGSIPFVYFNGKARIAGAEYNPELLLHGDFDQDAHSIIGGTSSLSASVYANSGGIVSEICRMTGGKPGSVCKSFPKAITK